MVAALAGRFVSTWTDGVAVVEGDWDVCAFASVVERTTASVRAAVFNIIVSGGCRMVNCLCLETRQPALMLVNMSTEGLFRLLGFLVFTPLELGG
jgi:hypothetical protein